MTLVLKKCAFTLSFSNVSSQSYPYILSHIKIVNKASDNLNAVNPSWFPPISVLLPEAGHGPLINEMSSMAMSPASPPTVASTMTWWTSCKVTWMCARCHSSPWFPDFCHTYRKDRRLIHWSQWGCEEVFATPPYAMKVCSLHSIYHA